MHYYYPLMNCSLFAAPYHRPRMHCSLFVASCQPPLILCSLFAPLCSRTLTFPIDHDTHPLRHGRILSNQSYPSPSLMVSTHLSHVQLRPRHLCSSSFAIPLYNPLSYVSKVWCPFALFSFFSPIHSFVYPPLSHSLQSFMRRLEIAFKHPKETFTSVTFFCRIIFTSPFLSDLKFSLSLSVGNK